MSVCQSPRRHVAIAYTILNSSTLYHCSRTRPSSSALEPITYSSSSSSLLPLYSCITATPLHRTDSHSSDLVRVRVELLFLLLH